MEEYKSKSYSPLLTTPQKGQDALREVGFETSRFVGTDFFRVEDVDEQMNNSNSANKIFSYNVSFS